MEEQKKKDNKKFHLLSFAMCLSPLCVQDGCTPAYIAEKNGHVEALELLCKNGADVNKARQASLLTSLNAQWKNREEGHLLIDGNLMI